MANISKIKRDKMIAFLEELKKAHTDDESIRAFNEIENSLLEKKYGLVFEEHTEEVDERLLNEIPVLGEDKERRLCKDENLPWNFIIEGDNLQALYLLEKTHKGRIDCIYIDPPYNTGAKDWKYNNNYVVETDAYRHSKWLSMMKKRLLLAKNLLKQECSVLICTVDEKEYLRLGCLLEELFPQANIQMISSVINRAGTGRKYEFSRTDEYLYFVRLGSAAIATEQLQGEKIPVVWDTLRRSGPTNIWAKTKKQFYPIFVDNNTHKIHSIGDPLIYGVNAISDVIAPKGCTAVFPIRDDGTEMMWGCVGEEFINRLKRGYIRVGKYTPTKPQKYIISYLTSGIIADIDAGRAYVESRCNDGSVNAFYYTNKEIPPTTNWNKPTHDAQWYGSNLIKPILGNTRFPYPKSLYAVKDCIYYVTKNHKNAIILDFFAGSGTTQHAVNLLNAEDGGNRQCIMVTNNEVSADEENKLMQQGYKKGDEEWEALGIAKSVTWPRTVCSINGCDINGKPLKGDYGVEDESYVIDEDSVVTSKHTGKPLKRNIYKKIKVQMMPKLAKIKKADGFQCNVKYFKCDWIPRRPEDYLLSNALCLHIKEMIELQTGREVDGIKQVLILNKDDYNKAVSDPETLANVETIWLNQNMILSPEELEPLKAKGFKYIPREFFGHELREAAE